MFGCKTCKVQFNTKFSYERHCNSIKHKDNLKKTTNKINEEMMCINCKKKYQHSSSFYRHRKHCTEIKEDLDSIKKEFEYKLEIEKLKYENEIKDLKIKELKKSKTKSKTKNINIHITNNISKLEFLNVNFGRVIDIHTFTENFKNEYGLDAEQSHTLLYNFKNNNIKSCINSLVYYYKCSAIKQYKDINNVVLSKNQVVLPFLLVDESLRCHFEKSNKKWNKTTALANIDKLFCITNDQIFKHHNEHMTPSAYEKTKIYNGILKESCFNLLSEINTPEMYKLLDCEENDSEIKSIINFNNIEDNEDNEEDENEIEEIENEIEEDQIKEIENENEEDQIEEDENKN